jgi:two-component system, LytTR family, response regulator AlgR
VLGVSAAQRILIVDDEPPATRRLERLVAALDDVEICGLEHDPTRVVGRCRDLRPDVVLLDIEMPGLNGVELARRLRALPSAPAVIFVTAFEQYAVEAFDLDAVDYLVKPVRGGRLERALKRARERQPDDDATLVSRIGDRTITVPVSEVCALVAEDKYTMVHHAGGMALIEESLVSLEERFPGRFIRVHRKALVAKCALRGLHRDADGQERVEVDGSDYCPPVSRRNLPALRKLLLNKD